MWWLSWETGNLGGSGMRGNASPTTYWHRSWRLSARGADDLLEHGDLSAVSRVVLHCGELDFVMASRPTNLTMLLRAIARRCPNCGTRGIFSSFTELRASCPTCGLRLHRGESDYFIGAYLLNLVAVELLFALLLAVVAVVTYPDTPWQVLQWASILLIIAGAVVCYPFAKAVWLAADLMLRPITEAELDWHRDGGDADRELPHL